MATLKEFEEALRQHGMTNALAILDGLKKRDREKRSIAPARRVVGRKMTADLARSILELHATTGMTQQEIAFKLGVNQGRVNEVIKRGKWLSADPHAPEALSRDKAMQRLDQRAKARRAPPPTSTFPTPHAAASSPTPRSTMPVSASSPPVCAPVTAEKLSGELPLERPEAVRVLKSPAGAKPRPDAAKGVPSAERVLSRHPVSEPTPIVSAQLAFLDL